VERASDGRVLVVADASVLINFLRAGRLDLLRHHEGYKIVVTEHARREVTYADQAPELAAALTAGTSTGSRPSASVKPGMGEWATDIVIVPITARRIPLAGSEHGP